MIVATVEILTDSYAVETSWDISTTTKDADDNIVESRDSFPAANTLYEDRVCLVETETCSVTDYTFTIYDSFGDGICCGLGNGYYKVTVEGNILAIGGYFIEYSEPTSLCQEPTPTASPTASPTAAPTQAPTASPTTSPTAAPTQAPTASPTTCSPYGSTIECNGEELLLVKR